MRVPVATESTVSPSITPGVRFNAPQVSNAGMEQVQQAGNAIQQGAQAYGKVQADILQDANRLRLDDAMTQAQQVRLQRLQEAKLLRGKDALYRGEKPLDEEFDGLLNQDLEAIGKTLGNDAQRQAWALESGAMRRQFRGEVAGHMAAEYKTYDSEVQQGKIATGLQMMQQSYDNPNDWNMARGVISDAVARVNAGSPPEYLKSKTTEALTPGHVSVVQSMLQGGQVQAARDYFARPDVQGELTPEARARLSGVLTTSVNDMEGQQAARDVMSTNPGASMKELDAALVARFGSNLAALDVARREIKYQRDLEETSKQETESALMRPVDSLLGDARLSGQSISRNQASAVLSPLKFSNPEAYAKATALIDAHNDEIRNERQAAEDRMSSLAVKSEEENAAAIKWDMVLNPDKYKNADVRAQLADLTGSKAIKPAGAAELLKLWQGIRDPSKGGNLKTMSTLAQYMDARLQGVMTGSPSDLKPFSGLGKPAQDAIRAKARAAIDRVMIDRQMSGQGISDKDARDIIDSMFVNTSIRSSFLGFSGASVPATKLDMTIGIPKAAIDFLKSNNTPQMRLEFDQKYGVGMAAAVTGK